MKKTFIQRLQIGFLLLAIGIILGAFAAHGLKGKLTIEQIASFETGVRYQIYVAFALIFISMVSFLLELNGKLTFRFMFIGFVFFSGSIYGLALNNLFNLGIQKILGPITPIGGLLLIVSLLIFIFQLSRISKTV